MNSNDTISQYDSQLSRTRGPVADVELRSEYVKMLLLKKVTDINTIHEAVENKFGAISRTIYKI